MGEGREGDWECSGCRNRNYAFRTFCNRCKQPRFLVDIHTPADSKWIPRIGDWICTACTNNNYASREKCKKCGQPKVVSAMPAISLPGSSLPNHSQYFARSHGVPEQKMHSELLSNGSLLHSFPLGFEWPAGGVNGYGISSAWPVSGDFSSGYPYANDASHLIPKDWRNGDWVCNCGFHNYASRSQCKKCSTYMPAAPRIKRSASEELAHDLDNKRLNAGETNENHNPAFSEQKERLYAPFGTGTSAGASNLQVNMSAILGNGAMHWRDGDWMCSYCNNHNYASRAQCNRCKAQRDVVSQPVGS